MANTPDTEKIDSIVTEVVTTPASTRAGTRFATTSTANLTNLPNNTQTGGAITGASSGLLMLEEIVINTAAAGSLAGPTNMEVSNDNAKGLTGAGGPFVTIGAASLAAAKTVVASLDGTVKQLPIVLESGKKIFIHGDDAGGSGGGVANIYCIWRRLSDGATVSAANIA